MANRISKRLVTFQHPFTLESVEGKWPAGNYTIETEEEPIDDTSSPAYRIVGTTMIVRNPLKKFAQAQYIEIEWNELDAALERDRAHPGHANDDTPSAI